MLVVPFHGFCLVPNMIKLYKLFIKKKYIVEVHVCTINKLYKKFKMVLLFNPSDKKNIDLSKQENIHIQLIIRDVFFQFVNQYRFKLFFYEKEFLKIAGHSVTVRTGQNDHWERGCRWFQLFFIDLSYFIFYQNHPCIMYMYIYNSLSSVLNTDPFLTYKYIIRIQNNWSIDLVGSLEFQEFKIILSTYKCKMDQRLHLCCIFFCTSKWNNCKDFIAVKYLH